MYSDVFCKVYNEFGWNYYPEAFGQQLCPGSLRAAAFLDAVHDIGTGALHERHHAGYIRLIFAA